MDCLVCSDPARKVGRPWVGEGKHDPPALSFQTHFFVLAEIWDQLCQLHLICLGHLPTKWSNFHLLSQVSDSRSVTGHKTTSRTCVLPRGTQRSGLFQQSSCQAYRLGTMGAKSNWFLQKEGFTTYSRRHSLGHFASPVLLRVTSFGPGM